MQFLAADHRSFRKTFSLLGQTASAFYAGLFLLSLSTMIYEIMLARLLSVVTWYYLALAAVGMAMSGMTAGALVVQLKPSFFERALHERRIRQGAFAMALVLPLGLVGMLAVPLALSRSMETVFSFSLFTVFAGLPFFFSGIVVCLALTRSPLPIGKLYLADLFGAATGCVISIVLLEALGAPGAILACSAIGFLAAAAFAMTSGEGGLTRRNLLYALLLAGASILNASSRYGIEPIWAKGKVESRYHLIAEDWNPISRVTASGPYSSDSTFMFGPSPKMPASGAPFINLSIDSYADTPLYRRNPGGPSQFEFLNYDVTSFAYLLRGGGGSAAIIGIGGGRDGLAAWLNGFTRIVGVEINGAIVDLDLRGLNWWSGLGSVPGLVIYRDDGRSFLTRSREKFDVIQASMIDTQAGTAAGARSTTENSLFTVEAWRIFYNHLAPGGVLTFSRWAPADSPQIVETLRIFSLAWDTLMSEGAANPADHLALIRGDKIATLLVRNAPFGPDDTARVRRLADQMRYQILYLPGQPPLLPDLNRVLAARSSADLAALRYMGFLNFAPVHDFSPFFYDFVRPSDLPRAFGAFSGLAGSEAIAFLLLFTLASLAVLVAALVIPLIGIGWPRAQFDRTVVAAAIYFIGIGLGFMFAEAAFMQQLTLLLGAPTHSLIVVLTGLIFFAGLGSLASDRLALANRMLPPAAAGLILLLLSGMLLPIAHGVASESLPSRIAIALVLVALPGFAMGACFPVGLRWLRSMNRDAILPWMWALNGGASVVATFGALLLSMQLSIGASVAFGGICYLVAVSAIALRPFPAPACR